MKHLSLSAKVFLFFWIPAVLFFLGMNYVFLKKYQPITKSEIHLPEEHRRLVESISKFMSIQRRDHKDQEIASPKKNPFYQAPPPPPTKDTKGVIPSEPLRLSMILKHEQKLCIINNKPYREGDKIGSIKIKKIGDYYVELWTPKQKKVRLEIGATYTPLY